MSQRRAMTHGCEGRLNCRWQGQSPTVSEICVIESARRTASGFGRFSVAEMGR